MDAKSGISPSNVYFETASPAIGSKKSSMQQRKSLGNIDNQPPCLTTEYRTSASMFAGQQPMDTSSLTDHTSRGFKVVTLKTHNPNAKSSAKKKINAAYVRPQFRSI